jgi:hypothetical protein
MGLYEQQRDFELDGETTHEEEPYHEEYALPFGANEN